MLSALRPAAQRWARRELVRAQCSTVPSMGRLPRRMDGFDEEEGERAPSTITADTFEAGTDGVSTSSPAVDVQDMRSALTEQYIQRMQSQGHFRWCKLKGIALCSDRKTVVVRGRLENDPETVDQRGSPERTTVRLGVTIDVSAFGITGQNLRKLFKEGDEVYAIGSLWSWLSAGDHEPMEVGSLTASEVTFGNGCSVPADPRTALLTPASLIALGKRRLQHYYMFMGGQDVDDICSAFTHAPKPAKVIDNLALCASHGLPMDWDRLVCEACINQPNHLSMAELLDVIRNMEPNCKRRDIYLELPQKKIMRQQADHGQGNTDLVYTQIRVATEYLNAMGEHVDVNIGKATTEPESNG